MNGGTVYRPTLYGALGIPEIPKVGVINRAAIGSIQLRLGDDSYFAEEKKTTASRKMSSTNIDGLMIKPQFGIITKGICVVGAIKLIGKIVITPGTEWIGVIRDGDQPLGIITITGQPQLHPSFGKMIVNDLIVERAGNRINVGKPKCCVNG